MKLFLKAISKFVFGILLVCVLLFVPAGTLNYFGGLLFTAILFIPILILGIILFIKSPELLNKRLDSKEENITQRKVLIFSGLIFILGFIVAGLDFRFGWSNVPKSVTVIACIVYLFSYVLYAEIMRENAYLSRTIKVQEGQKLVDSGLYGIVRHPMYTITIFLFLMIPLILGSWISFFIFLFYPLIIVLRIKNEEDFLTKNLEGYENYKKKVKFRLFPFIW